MGMRASSEKRIAGAAPHITFHWWGALPKADASMKVYVPKSVSLMSAIVKKKIKCYSKDYVVRSVFWSAAISETYH